MGLAFGGGERLVRRSSQLSEGFLSTGGFTEENSEEDISSLKPASGYQQVAVLPDWVLLVIVGQSV